MQGLLLQEFGREHVENVAVLGEDGPRLRVGCFDELADLVVDVASHLVAVIRLVAHRAAQERVAMLGAVTHRAQLGAHAVFGDHRAGDLGRLFDVGDRTGGGLAEHQFLGGPATHREHQSSDHLRAGHQTLVVLGNRHRVPTGTAAGQDGDLVDRLDVGHCPGRESMATFVVRGDLLLEFADHLALAAGTADDPVNGFFQRSSGDDRAVLAGGEQCRLVDDVGQVGTGHANSALGQPVEVGVRGQRLALGVHPQHCLAAGQVGATHRDLAVEAARAQQRGVEDVGPVGGRDQDDALTLAEAVHLDEQLVEGLLALVVAAAQPGAALTSDGVDLVDEDDARRVLFSLLEEVTHPGGADADEHLDEVRAGDGEERHAGFACHGAGQQRLARSGRAVEQHALGDLGAESLVPGRVLQEVLDLVELLDRFVGAGDVGEGGLRHVLGQQLGFGLAEAEAHPAAGLHPGEQHEEPDQHQQREHVDQQRSQHAGLVHRGVGLDAFAVQRVEERHGVTVRVLGDHLGGVAGLAVALLQLQPQLLLTIVNLRGLDVVGVDLRHGHRGVDRLEAAGVVVEVKKHPAQQQHHGDHRERADYSFPVHQESAPTGPSPSPSLPGKFQATAIPT